MNVRLLAQSILLMGFFCVYAETVWGAATNPPAQSLPYRFDSLSIFKLPPGMIVHSFNSVPSSAITTNATGNLGPSSSGGWAPEGENGLSLIAVTTGPTFTGAWVIGINTINKKNIEVRWRCRTLLQQKIKDNSVALQYRIGTFPYSYTTLENAPIYTSKDKSTGDSSAIYRTLLPQECNGKAEVYLRWIYYTALTGGYHNKIALDDVLIQESPESLLQTSTLLPFKAMINEYAAPQLLHLSATGFEKDIEIATSSDFEISLDNISFSTSLVLPATSNKIQLWVRPILSSVKSTVVGNIRFLSWGREVLSVPLTGNVVLPEPNPVTGIFTQEKLTDDAIERFAVSWDSSLAEGYLVVYNDPDFVPQDGIVYSLSSMIRQMSGQNIAYFDELKVGDSYIVSIFPYNNSGSDIDYCNTLSNNIISGVVKPVQGGIYLPYTCAEILTKQEGGSFTSAWVTGLLSMLTNGSDYLLTDARGDAIISLHYPTLPISSTVGTTSSTIPVLLKVGYDVNQGFLVATSYRWLTEGISLSDGLWEDAEGWYPGIPSQGQKVEILHTKSLDMLAKDSALFPRYKEIVLHREGALNIASGSVLQTDTFTILSDRSGAGLLLNQGSVSAQTSVVKHRFESLGQWEFISIPFDVKGESIIDFRQGDDQTTLQDNSFYVRYYDAQRRASLGSSAGNWTVLPFIADFGAIVLEKNKGYLVSLDQASSTEELSFVSSDSDFLNLKSKSLSLSSFKFQGDAGSIHSGWNLCGNPFVNSFDFTSLSSGEAYGNFAYHYDGLAYRLIEIGKDSPWQIPFAGTFFLKASQSTFLPLVNSSVYKSVKSNEDLVQIGLKISHEDKWDEALIRFDNQSTSGYDADKDGVKFLSSHSDMPQVAILSFDHQLALQSLPMESSKQIVPLWFSIPSDGWYNIDVAFENEVAFESIVLSDGLGGRIDLLRNPSHRVEFRQGIYSGKLNIELTRTALDSTRYPSDKAAVSIQSGIVYLSLPKEKAMVSVFDYAGRLIYQREHAKGVHPIESSFDKGLYLFKLTSGKHSETIKLMMQSMGQ